MPKAIWNSRVIAEAPDEAVEVVEGNVYFAPEAVRQDCLEPSATVTHCHWKGEASYFHVKADGQVNRDAAWTYRDPLPAARHVAGRIAFWRGVRIE